MPRFDALHMRVLAIDTSWKYGTLALARGDASGFEVLETAPLTGGAFSAQLVPQIAAVLARRNLRKQDLDAFAAVSGPGSFTGLRVGLAAIKGLVEVLQKPIATVSGLEALAIVSGASGRVFAALDAQRSEVFLGEYDVQSEKFAATALNPDSLHSRASLATLPKGAVLVCSDEAVADFARAHGVAVRRVERPDAGLVAHVGLQKILAGHTVTADALDANYVRRSDAEIFSTPKSQ